MEDEPFPIISIPDDAGEFPEALGTKEKFWIMYNGQLHLLKFGRRGTGEDWAEKVACELCALLDIPHADYALAEQKGRSCVLSPSFIPSDGRLVHGNELINTLVKGYDGTTTYHQNEHTVSRVLAALAVFARPRARSWRSFIGYIMFDAWIGNTDRHHENWGLVVRKDRTIELAPTFDHASSLGRELSDGEKLARLDTRDSRYRVSTFASKARSALYASSADKKPLTNLAAFREVAKVDREGARYWLTKLASVPASSIIRIVNRVPNQLISDPSRRFALELLNANRSVLVAMLG